MRIEATEPETPSSEIPLPESHEDLELLLQALHALNDALEQFEAAESTPE